MRSAHGEPASCCSSPPSNVSDCAGDRKNNQERRSGVYSKLPNFLQNTCQDLHQAVNLCNNVESESRPEITRPFQQGKWSFLVFIVSIIFQDFARVIISYRDLCIAKIDSIIFAYSEFMEKLLKMARCP
jgi:hypothetical protein